MADQQQPKPRYGTLNVAFGGPAHDPGDHSRRDGRPLYGYGADGRPLDRPRVEWREFPTFTPLPAPFWSEPARLDGPASDTTR